VIRARLAVAFRALAEVFANPNLRRLQLSWGIGWSATTAYVLALGVYSFDIGGAAAVGVLGVLRTLPGSLAAPFASTLIDRYPRARVLAVGLGARCVLGVCTVLAVLQTAPLWMILMLAALDMALSTTFWPAQAALIPTLATDPSEVTAANASSSLMEGLAVLCGPAIAAGLLVWTGPSGAFWAAAALFGIAATFGWRIHPRAARTEEDQQATEAPLSRDDRAPAVDGASIESSAPRDDGPWAAALGGISALWHHKSAGFIALMYLAFTGVVGAVGVLTVVIALDLLGMGLGGAGLLTSSAGIGGLLASVATASLAGSRRMAAPFAAGLFVVGSAIALIGGFPIQVVALAGFAAYGAGYTLASATSITLLQRLVPDDVLGRVMGVLEALYALAIAAGSIVATLAVATLGPRWALGVVGVGCLATVAVALPALRAIDRTADAGVSHEHIALLRSLPMFAPLSVATLEEVAHRVIALEVVAPGHVIITQGERGDRFYVVESGSVGVTVDGVAVPSLGPGEGFGEIALLKNVSRTATVTAETPTRLLALEREDFLATVAGYAPAHRAAGEVAAARLAAARPRTGMV